MDVKRLHIKEFSDTHLGHANTPTVHILDNLNTLFPNSPEFDCDIIFFAGDFFDKLMHVPDPNVAEIKRWINRFLRLCKKFDVVLRVLEGTPSHDWGQSRLFTDINAVAEIEADVKYVNTLSIEYIERFGIHVLYVPDEWYPETDDTWRDVEKLLSDHQIEQVDFSIMHGAFDYQLPSHVPAPTHVPQRYLDITRYFIFIGHIHTHSMRDRIIAAGSVDRLTHGEEEAKGYIDAVVRQSGEHEVTFIENKGAQTYQSIKCTGMAFEKAMAHVEKAVKKLRDGSFVRIIAARNEGILANTKILAKKYPTIRFDTKEDNSVETPKETLIDLERRYQPVAITRSNISKMLLDRLAERGWEQDKLQYAQEVLDGFIK